MYCIDIAQAGKYIAHTNVTGPRAIPAPKSPSLLEVLKVFYIYRYILVIFMICQEHYTFVKYIDV